MDRQSRRQAISDYKERKIPPGVFAVRCVQSGEVWVGQSPNPAQQKNRIWFALRQGGYPNPALRAAWTAHGEAAFSFEVLETVAGEGLSAYAIASLLNDRDIAWRETLGAMKIVG